MRERARHLIGMLAAISVTALIAVDVAQGAGAAALHDRAGSMEEIGEIASPFEGALKYPFTRRDSQECGRWRSGSQDYPYFGAPRDGNARKHTGIDLYPVKGAGTPIKAIRDGRVIRVAPFYQRRNGEMTYAVLIDHGEYAANYAELRKPTFSASAIVRKRQTLGFLSGTKQLHFELYSPGTEQWLSWHEIMPPNLIDPTDMMMRAFKKRAISISASAHPLKPSRNGRNPD